MSFLGGFLGAYVNKTSGGGNPRLSVVPERAAAFATLTNTASRNLDYVPGVDGVYKVVWDLTLKLASAGTYRTIQVAQRFRRVSGTCVLIGSAYISDVTGNSAGLGTWSVALATTGSADDTVRFAITNGTGESVSGYELRQVMIWDLVA